MKITRIRIPADFRVDDTRTRTAVADFRLGVGPCGKVVTELGITYDSDDVSVTQRCKGEIKVFSYPRSTLTGRVEVTYSEQDLGDDIEGVADGS